MEKTATTTDNVIVNAAAYLSSHFHHSMLVPSGTGEPSRAYSHGGRLRKRKRAKLARNTSAGVTHSTPHAPPNPNRTTRRPDPSAPKITRPCTECGRKFWSWKALFGHMRCHPEREWRGIDPPPGFRRPEASERSGPSASVSDEDHEVAACLLMLAAGGSLLASDSASTSTSDQFAMPAPEYSQDCYQSAPISGGFECSSCRKVFGTHQALGGHRASHKNVKGCFAITKSSVEGEELEGCSSAGNQIVSSKETNNNFNNGHNCSVCSRVFSTGQALGGHMRCHWEKVAQPISRVFGFDLNLAAPVEDDHDEVDNADFACSSGRALDLRLGL